MAQPTPYTPVADFTQDEANSLSGRSTVSTAKLDGEFAAVEQTLDAVCANLEMIQRDDGFLRDGAVRAYSFAPDALLLMAGSWIPRGAWVTATQYAVGNVVANGTATYVAAALHMSGVFATDLAAGKWLKIYETGSVLASGVIFTPVGGVAATNLQAAVAELDSEKLSTAAAASTYMTQASGNQIPGAIVAQSYTAFMTSGSAPNYTLTPSAAISDYSVGLRFNVTFHASSPSGSTISVSGLPAKGLKQYDEAGAKITASIYAGMVSDIVYDGTDFVVLDSISATQGFRFLASGGTPITTTTTLGLATAGNWHDVQSGGITVTMPDCSSLNGKTVYFFRGAVAFTLSAQSGQVIISTRGTSGQTLPIKACSTVVLVANGAYGWYALIENSPGFADYAVWQDVTVSRAVGTTYTNNQSHPIQVSIRFSSGSVQTGTLTVSGVVAAATTSSSTNNGFVTAVVPVGANYSFTGAVSMTGWAELR